MISGAVSKLVVSVTSAGSGSVVRFSQSSSLLKSLNADTFGGFKVGSPSILLLSGLESSSGDGVGVLLGGLQENPRRDVLSSIRLAS